MIYNFNQPAYGVDVTTYPEWTFPAVPQEGIGPGPILREVVIIRANAGTGAKIKGNVDDAEVTLGN